MPPSTSLPPLRAIPSSRVHLRFPSSPPPLLSQILIPRWPPPLRAYASGESIRGNDRSPGFSGSAFDALLSAAELLCLAPPAICSMVCAVRLALPNAHSKPLLALAGDGRLFIAQYAFLVGAVAIGGFIRRWQWGRLCRVSGGAAGRVDLVGRVEKVEESVRGVVTAVGLLSRSVEKLGVRFRMLRRALRDPITEAAALAQKNSEATRILSAQEDLLEKELGAIQKVLYAMQAQQQKQLDLIIAIGEASRILDNKQHLVEEEDTIRSSCAVPETGKKQVRTKDETFTGGNNKG